MLGPQIRTEKRINKISKKQTRNLFQSNAIENLTPNRAKVDVKKKKKEQIFPDLTMNMNDSPGDLIELHILIQRGWAGPKGPH